MILIITIKDDLHALKIQSALQRKGYPDCHILECDQISSSNKLFWTIGENEQSGLIKISTNLTININDIALIWWRRVRADQDLKNKALDTYQTHLINNDCRGTLSGILEANFRGKWVSDPAATDKAANKIYQLSVAKACGFRIPDTLITQSKNDVKEFVRRHDGQVIVKPVVGAAGPLIFTEFLKDPDLFEESSFSLCPAVYQEYIEGTKHIRLNCFGNNFFAAIIDTPDLDWRPNLNVPIREWEVSEKLRVLVRAVLDQIGLEMGVIDIKLTPDNEFVWLEVNPQGQFLFLEPLIDVPLAEHFADFLLERIKITNVAVGMS